MKMTPYAQQLANDMRNAPLYELEFTESQRAEILALAHQAITEAIGRDIIERRSWPWYRRLMK